MNTLETLRAAIVAHHAELVLAFRQANPRITALCSPAMVHAAMGSSIHDLEIFHLVCFNDLATNYILSRLAQSLGVRQGTQEQFRLTFLDGEEPSDELVALADQFLVNVTPDCAFPATYWDEQICELIAADAEMPESEEDEDFEPEHEIAAPPTRQAPAAAQAPVKMPCREWAQGKCKFGDKCRFAHEPVAVVAAGGAATKKPCRDWAVSKSCKFGDNCRFGHFNDSVPS